MSDGDCDDCDANIHPGAAEIPYNRRDDDCDSSTRDDDLDGDGHLAPPTGADCDDANPFVYPGAAEHCGDGIDQDCDGEDLACTPVDGDGDGYTVAAGDCDDRNPSIHPGATEVPYNGLDDDCDPLTRDDDLDGDGHRAIATGGGDCDDTSPSVYPGASEIPYDGIDQDCRDGDLVDVDDDGHDASMVGGDDCNDHDAAIHPGAIERPYDGTDQDCDGSDIVSHATVLRPNGYSYGAAIVGGTEGFMVAYRDDSTSTHRLYARAVSRTGVASPAVMLRSSSSNILGPALARLRSGQYVLAWGESRSSDGGVTIHALTIDRSAAVIAGGTTPLATVVGPGPDVGFGTPTGGLAAIGNGSGQALVHHQVTTADGAVTDGFVLVSSTSFTTAPASGACTGDAAGNLIGIAGILDVDYDVRGSSFVASCGVGGEPVVYNLSTAGVASAPYALGSYSSTSPRAATAWNGSRYLTVLSPWISSTFGASIQRYASLPPTGPRVDLGPSGSGSWFATDVVAVGSSWALLSQDLAFGNATLSVRWVDSAGAVGPAIPIHAPGPGIGASWVVAASSGSEAYVLGGDSSGLIGILVRP